MRLSSKTKLRLTVLAILILALFLGFLDAPQYWDRGVDWLNPKIGSVNLPHFPKLSFHLGLDLQGGTHLEYEADLTNIEFGERGEAMEGIRDVIERRVNIFGVQEPIVQVAKGNRLIVELAGIKDVYQAIQMIGETPYLDFREERPEEERKIMLEAIEKGEVQAPTEDPYFVVTPLSGKQLKRAQLQFDPQSYKPTIGLEFNDEGKKLFTDLTRKNVGKRLAIYLDGVPISIPVVREVITGGKAVISGDFTVEEAKQLTRRLNSGALPVPINLISQQTVGASLGKISLEKSLFAGIIGLIAVALFMIFYYRLAGVLAVIALAVYVTIVLGVFKLSVLSAWPITLTLAGIAGFILSMGIAVDANVLIFERMREEMRRGKSLAGSIDEGFKRAWPSIRDGNVSTLITCLVLYVFTTGMIKGFAITLGIGVIISMFSAIMVTRSLLKLFVGTKVEEKRWLWGVRK